MKKKLAVATTAVLAMTMCLSMTACKDKASVGALLPKVKGSYSVSVTPVSGFNNDITYDQISSKDSNNVIILTKSSETTTYYSLYNVQNNTTLIDNVAEEISRINNTLYATYNDVSKNYTLYDSSSTSALYTNIEGAIDEEKGIFVCNDGTRIYSTPNGKVKEERNPFEKILSSDAEEVGDYYLDGDIEEGTFDVYNEKGDLKHSVNLKIELNISANAELDTYWAIGNKLFFQTTRALPEAEEDYDYYVADTKWDLDTYSYDLKKGSGRELKNFDYHVNYAYAMNDNTAVAYVQKIADGSLSQSYMQSFNANGKVAVDLQKLVPGTTACAPISKDTLRIYDRTTGYSYLYKGSKRIAEVPLGYEINENFIYKYFNSNLNIYDFNGNLLLNEKNVTDYNFTYTGDIIYSVLPESNDTSTTYESYYLFDISKKISTLLGTESATIRISTSSNGDIEHRDYYYSITNSITGKTDYHFFDNNNTVITANIDGYKRVLSYEDDESGSNTYIVKITNDTTVSYYEIVRNSYYVKD